MLFLRRFLRLAGLFAIICLSAVSAHSAPGKLVIASGGAAGYLLPNTLPSLAMAVVMQPDSIKMDLVLSKDNQPMGFDSLTLGKATNVSDIFPERIREDGSYYVIDFTADEIQQLTLKDTQNHFPAALALTLSIPTFAEELALIRALEIRFARSVPIAVELKQLWYHQKEGRDLSRIALTVLKSFNYTSAKDDVSLLSYDAEALKRAAKELLPGMQLNIKLIQLIDTNDGKENMQEEWGELVSYNYDWMFSKSGLRSIARYAAGVALPKTMLSDASGTPLLTDFVEDAHQLGMSIYTFPINRDDHLLLPYVSSFTEELEFFYYTAGVDGIFTDYCQDGLSYLQNRTEPPPTMALDKGPTPPQQLSMDPLQLIRPTAVGTKE
jgi:glycerophosphoryl diester phosphodiesterase